MLRRILMVAMVLSSQMGSSGFAASQADLAVQLSQQMMDLSLRILPLFERIEKKGNSSCIECDSISSKLQQQMGDEKIRLDDQFGNTMQTIDYSASDFGMGQSNRITMEYNKSLKAYIDKWTQKLDELPEYSLCGKCKTADRNDSFTLVYPSEDIPEGRICPICGKVIKRVGVYHIEQLPQTTFGLQKSDQKEHWTYVMPIDGSSIEEISKYEYGDSKLIFPVSTGRVTSPFGPRKINYGSTNHGGVDVGNSIDGNKIDKRPIIAPCDAVVVYVRPNNPSGASTEGNAVAIQAKDKMNGGDYGFRFLHMSSIADGMSINKSVKRGDVLGYVGGTGGPSQFLPHLHMDLFMGKVTKNNGRIIHENKVNPGIVFNRNNARIPEFCQCGNWVDAY